jgi:cytochrome c-type biogenesis protein CcsB
MECCAISNHSLTFFWWSFIAYSAAIVTYIVFLVSEKSKISALATLFMAAGFAFQTAAVVSRGLYLHRIPLTNMFEFISLLAWFSALCYFVVLRIYKWQILGAFISPVIFMLMVASSLLPKDMDMQLVPALQSYWLQIHVTVAAFGEAAFAIGFAANLMYFIKRRLNQTSALYRRLPDENTLDMVSYKAVTAGYPLFTIGALFAGAIWAEQAWGSFWSWDPKEVGSLVVWLVYTAYLHARLVKGWSGTRAAVLSSIGFICTLLTFFANMFLGGLHAYGVN